MFDLDHVRNTVTTSAIPLFKASVRTLLRKDVKRKELTKTIDDIAYTLVLCSEHVTRDAAVAWLTHDLWDNEALWMVQREMATILGLEDFTKAIVHRKRITEEKRLAILAAYAELIASIYRGETSLYVARVFMDALASIRD